VSANEITLVVDGVEVNATEGEMLVDAAKGGDVEIPVFCYEPKIGGPVGACRMCLVEIEGIPKLQTACSTPVRDGMVVYTRTDRVVEAQNAVVEFLLVNHPLDCPVCDKGGECPLQDIAMGWGPGRSRFTDPKRHFRKPVPLSPLVRIDRERCILCYRCVRFSQEVAEDEQLQLLERGASSFVGTFDDRPYIAPFHGNIIELCPVGALTSEAYRFRARPWDIEDSGSICTLCPSQCNVKFTVRDERIQRVLARDNHEVDNGWLCDKGRFGFQMINSEERITAPRLSGNPVGWDQALETAAAKLASGKGRIAAIVGGQSTNEEAYLTQRIVRGALESPHVTTMDELEGRPLAALSTPQLGASIAAIEAAESVLLIGADPLNSMPILDLRLRKAVRNSGTRLVIASDRPTALDGGAEETARYLPGEAAAFLAMLADEIGDGPSQGGDYERLAGELRPGKTLVIWGEGLGRGPGGVAAMDSLVEIATALDCGAEDGGVFSVPEGSNARGAREVGAVPGFGPGFSPAADGRRLEQIKQGLLDGDLDGVILVHADPVRDLPDGPRWAEALRRARTVLAISSFDDSSTKAADVVFCAEAYAEKEGTVTHPDGRLQRLRPAVPRPDLVRPVWQVLAELAAALGDETEIDAAPEALAAIAAEVPFYAGLTAEEIGGTGIRWQGREAASGFAPSESNSPGADVRVPARPSNGALRLGTYRDLWADEVTERNEALRFLVPQQRVEIAPADADRLGLADGDEVAVRSNGHSVRARVALRERMRPGAAFLIEGTVADNANALNGADVVEIERVGGAPRDDAGVAGP